MSVSLLARQTGFGPSHLSNFLHVKRQLSLDAMDRILAALHMAADDLLPGERGRYKASLEEEACVPVVSPRAALFSRFIRPDEVQMMLRLPPNLLGMLRPRAAAVHRGAWERFVAVHVFGEDALPMDPVISPDAYVIIDRHYKATAPYQGERASIFTIQYKSQLRFRYVEFTDRCLVLRPHNNDFAVEVIQVEIGYSPADFIVGRVAHILNAT